MGEKLTAEMLKVLQWLAGDNTIQPSRRTYKLTIAALISQGLVDRHWVPTSAGRAQLSGEKK